MKKNFEISEMLSTLGGNFYPTGHIIVLMKHEEELKELEEKIMLINQTDYYKLSSSDIIKHMTPLAPQEPLPSVGTEGAALRGYIDLAHDGYGALLIKIEDENKDFVMDALEQFDNYTAKHYRMLIIEDISRPSLQSGGQDIIKENIAEIIKK